jgi:hypothetical protein
MEITGSGYCRETARTLLRMLIMPQAHMGCRIMRSSGPTFFGGCPRLAGRTDPRDLKDVAREAAIDLAHIRTEIKDEKAFQISDAPCRLRDSFGVYRSIRSMGSPLL